MTNVPESQNESVLDKYNLHGVGGYTQDPSTRRALDALQARWDALTPEIRELAKKELERRKLPDGPGR